MSDNQGVMSATAIRTDTSHGVRRRGLLTVPAVAGIAYSTAWIAGLTIYSSSTDVHTSADQLLAEYAGHQGAAIAQYAITEGVTSVLLVTVALAIAWLQWTGVVLAVTITLSGIGYLLLLGTLSVAAYASLPLLMLDVTAAGILAGRAGRAGR